MELRKNPAIDLENKRGMFLSIGLTISLSLTVIAFNWTTEIVQINLPNFVEEADIFYDISPIVTVIEPVKRPEVPKPSKKTVVNPTFIENDDIKEVLEELPVIDIDEPEVIIDEGNLGEVPEEIDPNHIHDIVETKPEPNGGITSFYKAIGQKLKYPRLAKRQGIEGRVITQFVVDKDGSLTDIKILKGIGGGCDEEAIRVLQAAAKWSPGKQRGRPVKVRMIIPIVFQLN